MSLKMTKKILGLILLIFTAVLLTGCVRVEDIRYIQRYVPNSSSANNIHSYGWSQNGEVVINQEIEVRLKLLATTNMTGKYLFLSVAVPQSFTPADENPNCFANLETSDSPYKLKPYAGVPSPTDPIPLGYKWVTYAVFEGSESTPTTVTYNKGNTRYAKLIFNVGDQVQMVNPSNLVRQAASNTPTEVEWKAVGFNTNALNKILHIRDEFFLLSERKDNHYYIFKNSCTLTDSEANETGLKGFYVGPGITLTLPAGSEKTLNIEADHIIVNGVINAVGKGSTGKSGGAGGVGGSGGTVNYLDTNDLLQTELAKSIYNGEDGINGTGSSNNYGIKGTGGFKSILDGGKGGKSGKSGKPGNPGLAQYLLPDEEITTGKGGKGGGGGGGGGAGLFHCPWGNKYLLVSYSGGKGGDGGTGGKGGGSVRLSGKQVYIGGQIHATASARQPGTTSQVGQGGNPTWVGGTGGQKTGFDSQTGDILSDGQDGYPKDGFLSFSSPDNKYLYEGPWNSSLPAWIIKDGTSSTVSSNLHGTQGATCIFNSDGSSLIIKTAFDVSNLSFYIKGTPNSNNCFSGIFKVESSNDGNNYDYVAEPFYAWRTVSNSVIHYNQIPTTETLVSLNNIKSRARYIKLSFFSFSGTAITGPEKIYIDYLTITKRSGYKADGGGGGGGAGGTGGSGGGGAVLIKATQKDGLTIGPNAIIDARSVTSGSPGFQDGEIAFITPDSITINSDKIKTGNSIIHYQQISGNITTPTSSTKIKWGTNIEISWSLISGSIKNLITGATDETLTQEKYRFSFSTDDGASWKRLLSNPLSSFADDWEAAGATVKTWTTGNSSSSSQKSSNKVRIRMEIKDQYGKISEIISEPFTIDSDGPVIGSVTFPAGYERSSDIPVTWSGVYDELVGMHHHQIAIISTSGGAPEYRNTGRSSPAGVYNLYIAPSFSGMPPALPSGLYNILFKATDQLGNEINYLAKKEGTNSASFLRDIDPPTLTVKFDETQNTLYPKFDITIEDAYSNLKSAKIKIILNESTSLSYSLLPDNWNDKKWSNGSYTLPIPLSNNTTYSIEIEAEDTVGNKITKPFGSLRIETSEYSLTIDTIAPLNNHYTSANPTISWSETLPGGLGESAGFRIEVYSAASQSKVYTYVFDKGLEEHPNKLEHQIQNPLAEGEYVVLVKPGSYLFVTSEVFNVDADAPTIAEDPKTLPPALTSEANFVLLVNDPLSGIDEVKVTILYGTGHVNEDGTLIEAGTQATAPHKKTYNTAVKEQTDQQVSYDNDWKSLKDGNYTYKIEAVDDVGNAMVPQTGSFVFDKTAPIILAEGLLDTDKNIIYVNNPSINIAATVKEPHLDKLYVSYDSTKHDCTDDQGFDSNSESHEINLSVELSEGSHLITIEAIDQLGQFTKIKKTVIVDTINPVISEIKVQGIVVQPNGTVTVSTLTPYIKITINDANPKDISAEVTPIGGGTAIVLGTDDLNNSSSDFTGENKLQNGQAYQVIIEAQDKANNSAVPVAFYINVIQGKVPSNLKIEKEKQPNNFYTNNYLLSWSCNTLVEGDSYQVFISNNPIDEFMLITDKDTINNDKNATIELTPPANNTTHYIQVKVQNMDGSLSLPSNNVLIKSIVLSNTSTNTINFPVNSNDKLNILAKEIQYSNLNGFPYTNPEMLDLISITHVATNKTYQMYYIGDNNWYKDSSNNMPTVKINDTIKVNVSQPLNWIIVGNMEVE